MDERLIPRKAPEPAKFPSFIFEPCVPDASLIFGCGLFEVPKTSAEVRKPTHEAASTEDFLHRSTQETAVPSWIKAYGVQKKASVDVQDLKQSDRDHTSTEDSDKRTDVEVFERNSVENFSEGGDSGLGGTGNTCGGAGNTCVGKKTVVGNRETKRSENKNSETEVLDVIKSCETFGKSAVDSFSENTDTDSFAVKYGYRLEGSKVGSLRTLEEIPDYRCTELHRASVSRQHVGDVERNTGQSALDMSVLSDAHSDDTASVVIPATGKAIKGVAECGSSSRGLPDYLGGGARYSYLSDRITPGEMREVTSDVSAPRQLKTYESWKEENKFPEPQKSFLSSDCSLSDNNPPNSRRRKGKWKNVPVKESDQGSVLYEKVGRAAEKRVPCTVGKSKSHDSPRRTKRRSATHLDFQNVSAAEEFAPDYNGARGVVSDPLIRALFHLQNRQTELLLKLSEEVSEVAFKQRRMFDVFQKLQSAFCESGTRSAPEVRSEASVGGDRRNLCHKCTQTSSAGGEEQAARTLAAASTQAGRRRDADGERTRAASIPGGGIAAVTESKGSPKVPENGGVAVCAASKDAKHLARSRPVVADRSESRERGVRTGPDMSQALEASGSVASPQAVRKLIRTMRSIAARVEDSGSKSTLPSEKSASRKTGVPSEPADERRDPCVSSSQEVGGLIKTMRGLASRYKNNDFIKAPNLEDVAEASENSSDSEDSRASEAADVSLTIGDLSLVPQNVSMSPNPSLRIDLQGLDISLDALASGSEDTETEASAHCSKEKGDPSGNTDSAAMYLYRNIFSKVQGILEHNKPASESRRDSFGNKPATSEAENGRMRAKSH